MDKKIKIAIVGGGLSGLVLAEGLERRGYKNVCLFERKHKLGGKLHSINYKGRSHELGAIFGLPSYKHLIELMERLGIRADGPKLTRTSYNSQGVRVMSLPQEELPGFLKELERLPEITSGYQGLSSPNFENVEEVLMKPFLDWCDHYGFEILKTIYTHYFTIFGLGSIEEVPALYVLRILSYEHLMGFMGIPRFLTWKDGISVLADALAKDLSDVRLGQEVRSIKRREDGKIILETPYESLAFDKLILASPLDQFAKEEIWDEKTSYFLRSIKYQKFNTYAFVVDELPRGSGFILDNLTDDRRGHVIIWDARWYNQAGREGLLVVYAYDPPEDLRASRLELIKKDLEDLGMKGARFYQARHWKHCPYVSEKVLQEGFYEHLNQIQGQDGIYLAGEVVSGLSTENSIWHSSHLLERFFPEK